MLSPSSLSADVWMAQCSPQKLLAGLLLSQWWGPLQDDTRSAMVPALTSVVTMRHAHAHLSW